MTEYTNGKAPTESKTTTAPADTQGASWRVQLKKSLAGEGYQAACERLQCAGSRAGDVSVAQQAFRGGGGAVPHAERVGRAIGADLCSVQAYTGPAATAACKKLGAEAFTYGNKMAFADPSPTPQLVAHEGTHAVHQGAAASAVGRLSTAAGDSGSAMEAEADANMRSV